MTSHVVGERRAALEPFHQHVGLCRRCLRRRRVVAGPVGQLGLARRRNRDLRDVIRLFREVELRAVGEKEVAHLLSRHRDL